MIIVLTGPTASGKTKAAINLAKRLGAVIINGDAFQVYKEIDIASAKPTPEQFLEAPHYLFDFIAPNEEYNVFEYQADLRACIAELEKRGTTMIIAGGSGLYIRAGLYDYDFKEAAHLDMSRFDNESNEELHAYLASFDPISAKAIHPNNRVRVLRAIEIYLQSGISKSELEAKQNHAPLYDVRFFTLKKEREDIYQNVEVRVEHMFQDGLEKEARHIYETYGKNAPACKAIGIKEFFPYFEGNIALEEVKKTIILNTRHYVKRQETFFRHQFPSLWVKDEEEILENI